MKSFLIIGMGKFGHHLCDNLLELGNDVMIVDKDEEKVSDLVYRVTNVQIGDCSTEKVVKSLGVSNFDTVFVCMSDDFQNSLEVTNLVKEMGAKYVISQANRDVHAKFLLKNGADEVIYPDKDIAERFARKCSSEKVFDFIDLDDEYSIFEIPPLRSWIGHTIRELNIRQHYDINILAVKGTNGLKVMPSVDYAFKENEHLMVVGHQKTVYDLLKRKTAE